MPYQAFHERCGKMTQYTVKILQCSQTKIFTIRLAIFQHYTYELN